MHSARLPPTQPRVYLKAISTFLEGAPDPVTTVYEGYYIEAGLENNLLYCNAKGVMLNEKHQLFLRGPSFSI
jgi:hypothetical protein